MNSIRAYLMSLLREKTGQIYLEDVKVFYDPSIYKDSDGRLFGFYARCKMENKPVGVCVEYTSDEFYNILNDIHFKTEKVFIG